MPPEAPRMAQERRKGVWSQLDPPLPLPLFLSHPRKKSTGQLVSVCVYCGDAATEKDHIIPYSYAGMCSVRSGKAGNYAGETVPACKDCNSWLGSRMILTVAERKKAVARSLPKRYAKLLKAPNWTLEELEEIEQSLRTAIETTAKKKAAIKRRIRWASEA
jgi:hypothetical protein